MKSFPIKKKAKDTNQLIFYITMMIIPIFMFIVLNIFTNIEYFMLSFREYNPISGTYSWVWLKNFERVIRDFFLEESILRTSFYKSLVLGAFRTFVGLPLAILFSYYVARKKFLHKFFYITLFIPTIISSMVMVFLYSYFVDSAIPALFEELFNKTINPPLGNLNSQWGMIILFNIVFSFGANVIIFVGSITGINNEIIESAKLDGVTPLKELIYIVTPLIFPTITTFIVVRIASLFADTAVLYSFFGEVSTHQTIGYYLYKNIMAGTATRSDYTYLSAIGILFSAFIIPITIIVKRLLERIGTED